MTTAPHARPLLAALALSTAVPGLWATLAPHGFYAGFPGPPAGAWVSPLGPFDEHLVRDVGAFYLAFTLLLAWAAWRPDRALVVPVAAGWCAFSLLHLVFHALHADALAAGDAVGQTVALAAVLVVGGVLLRPVRSTP